MAQSQFHPDVVRMIMAYTSPEDTAQGMRIFHQGSVLQVDQMQVADRVIFEFYVEEAGRGEAFGTGIEVFPDGQLDSECSCSDIPCAHEAAAIFYLVDEGLLKLASETPDATDSRTEIPAWQRALDSVLPPVLTAEDDPEPEVCLFFSAESGSLRIRPGEPGKRGWIKGKAKWDALYTLRCSRHVRSLLQEFYEAWLAQFRHGYGYGWGYGYQADWLPLEKLAVPRLWEHLVQLRNAGVALVSWEGKHPVELDPEVASVRLAASQSGADASLELRPEVSYGGTRAPREGGLTQIFLGAPTTVLGEVRQDAGVKTQRIRIRPLGEPIPEDLLPLFDRQQVLQVEPEHRTEFESHYLPRLQQLVPVESPDNSYQPPQPQPGVLNLRVTPVTGDSQELNYLHLQWKWDRGPLGTVDSEHEAKVLAAVQETGATMSEQRLPRDKAVPFLANTLPRIEQLDHVRVTRAAEVPEFRQATDSPQVSVGMSAGEQDWFDLQVEVTVGGEKVSFAELFTALSQNQEIFVLPSGTYFDLDTPELDQLRRIIEEAKTLNDTSVDNLKVSRYQVDLWEELVETGIVDAQEHDWWNRIRTLNDAAEQTGAASTSDTTRQVPESVQAELRDYQKSGYRWLDTLRRNELGGVLADDMGLGKTLQVIAMISAVVEADPESDPFLVIAPTSVVGNWVREIEKFAPGLRAVSIEGTEKKRGTPLTEIAAGAQVLVTSYTLFRLEAEAYAALEWSAAIFDEAQMIKNHTSKAYKSARLLDVAVKIAVTGTPMENNLMELWALVSLTSPGLLGGKTHFTEFYRSPIEKEKDAERLDLLQRRLRPFLLRRTKELVAADLPAKSENVMELDLYPKHRKIYDRRLQRERQKVLGLVDDLNTNRFEVFRSLTLLRQLALDTELAAEDAAPSAKLDYLADLLASAATDGHRVLVLSQFTRFLGKARSAATEAGVDSLYLDGKTRNRQKLIDQFRDGETPVFFISLKAGGFGLNLTEADYVVLLDPWWNPATEAQAVDRAHRIGQTRQVMVYRLVARDTIEAKVMDLKQSKAALFDRVLAGGGTVEADGLGAADIKALLE